MPPPLVVLPAELPRLNSIHYTLLIVTYIWNIYEPADAGDPGDDPFDVFLYALRKEDVPHTNDPIHVEGQRKRIIAIQKDQRRNELLASHDEEYYKVCVN